MSTDTATTTVPTLGFWAMLTMLWGFVGKLLMLGNQTIDMAGKGVNAVDQVVSAAEKHAIAFHENETAKLLRDNANLLEQLSITRDADGKLKTTDK